MKDNNPKYNPAQLIAMAAGIGFMAVLSNLGILLPQIEAVVGKTVGAGLFVGGGGIALGLICLALYKRLFRKNGS